MKRRILKSAVALLLTAVSVFSVCSVALAATENYPVIYIYGRTAIYNDVSTDKPTLIRYSRDDAMMNLVKQAVPYAARAVTMGDWDTYNEKVYNLLMDMFEGFPLDENGEVCNDSGVLFSWSEKDISSNYMNTNINTYNFQYDARLSPLEIAVDLNRYIEAVKRVTGRNKVSIVARCLGTNVLFAYLYKYQEKNKYKGIDSIVLYDGSIYGVDMLDAAMSGEIKADANALGNFLNSYDPNVENENLATVLALSLGMLKTSYGINISASVVDNFYAHMKDGCVKRFVKDTYATSPGFWSMVYNKYDEAMEFLFDEPGDLDKYSVLISKINTYRSAVQERAPKMIKDMKAAGVHVAMVCKYGFQGYPLYEDCNKISDNTAAVWRQSFFATGSDYDSTLGKTYVNARVKAGYGDYISPDEQVDASTGILPDTTWYIKNYQHNQFLGCVDPLLLAICRNKLNVHTNAKWPQFMILEKNGNTYKALPMTAENSDPDNRIEHDGDNTATMNFFQRIISFFRYFIGLIRTVLGL